MIAEQPDRPKADHLHMALQGDQHAPHLQPPAPKVEVARPKRAAAHKRLREGYEQEKSRRQDLEASLKSAHDIQQNFIPSSPPTIEGFDLCGVYLPAELTGGDFFDYLPMDEGTLAIVVADVAGHGVGPALLAAETRACIRTLASMSSDVGEIATTVNRLVAQDMPSGGFATLFLAKLDPDALTLTYAAAGHCAFIVSPSGESVMLQSQAVPLGIDDRGKIPSTGPVQLNSGDIVLLATDGLFETRSPEGTMLGTPRCMQVVYRHRQRPAELIVDELLHAMHAFAQDAPQRDDVTIVVAKVR